MTTTRPEASSLVRPSIHGHDKRVTYLRGFLSGRGYFTALEAMDFAFSLHDGTRRDGTTPEIAHQCYIVGYLTTLLPHLLHPETTLAVGFLHDTVEDKNVTVAQIESMFGEFIASGVDAMSKEVEGVKRSPEHVMQMQAAHPVASIAKAADRINNQQTMAGVFSTEKILSYLDETKTTVLPMIKQARRRFPQQQAAYENAKTVLWAQVELLEAALAGMLER